VLTLSLNLRRDSAMFADRRADRTINRSDQPSFSGRESDSAAKLNEL
jgi:hypothetical protein